MLALILSLKGMLPSAPIKHACLSAWQLSAAWEVRASSLGPNHPLAGWRMPGKFSRSLASMCSGAHRKSDWCLLWTDPRERSWKGRGTAGPITALLMACKKGPGGCLWGKGRLTPCCVCPQHDYGGVICVPTHTRCVMLWAVLWLCIIPSLAFWDCPVIIACKITRFRGVTHTQ